VHAVTHWQGTADTSSALSNRMQHAQAEYHLLDRLFMHEVLITGVLPAVLQRKKKDNAHNRPFDNLLALTRSPLLHSYSPYVVCTLLDYTRLTPLVPNPNLTRPLCGMYVQKAYENIVVVKNPAQSL
jgi:hypothetical protein